MSHLIPQPPTLPASSKGSSEDTTVVSIRNLCTQCLAQGYINTYCQLFSLLHLSTPCIAPISLSSNALPFYSNIDALSTLTSYLKSSEDALNRSDFKSFYYYSSQATLLLSQHKAFPAAISVCRQAISTAETQRDRVELIWLIVLGMNTYVNCAKNILENNSDIFDSSCLLFDSLSIPISESAKQFTTASVFNESCSCYKNSVLLAETALSIIFDCEKDFSKQDSAVKQLFDYSEIDIYKLSRNYLTETANLLTLLALNSDSSAELWTEIVSFRRKALALTERIEGLAVGSNQSIKFLMILNLARALVHSEAYLEASNCYYSAIDTAATNNQIVLSISEFISFSTNPNGINLSDEEIKLLMNKAEKVASGDADLMVSVLNVKGILFSKQKRFKDAVSVLEDGFKLSKIGSPSGSNSKLLKITLGVAKSQCQMENTFANLNL
ncbi:hypothetical protein RCL1_003048 [Eukaryota sp. TZLM3-RCL]